MVDVELDHGFKYNSNGADNEAKFINIVAFTMKQMDKVAPVKEIVFHALANMSNSMSDDDKVDVHDAREEHKDAIDREDGDTSDHKQDKKVVAETGKVILTWVYQYGTEGDTAKLWAYMKKLLTSGVASIDGETKLTGNDIDSFHPSDFEKLCGEYIGNFITS